jgi:hypothetical protein
MVMTYVSSAMFMWFLLITAATIYGMVSQKSAKRFDVAIGFIIAPLLTFIALFILVGGCG